MSTNVFVRTVEPRTESPLSKDLKRCVALQYFDGQTGSTIIGYSDLPFFQGLAIAGVKDAKYVEELLEAKGELEIWVK